MRKTQTFGIRGIYAACLGLSILIASPASRAQNPAKVANLSGQVTADQGAVRSFRVKARDTLHRISFTVYTVNGQYHVYNLPPSLYEVQVIEQGFQSPVQQLDLKAGGNAKADFALTAKPASPGDVEFVDYDEAYPPGPGRDLLQKNCVGCHGVDGVQNPWLKLGPHTEDEWRMMIRMPGQTEAGIPMIAPDDISPEDMDTIAKYMAQNFGPDSKRRRIKKDELVRDEGALSKALYIEYELPSPPSYSDGRPRPRALHSPAIAPDGMIYWSDTTDTILQLDPRNLDFETRSKDFVVPNPTKYAVHPSGIIWSNGKIYFAENGSELGIGELDPKSGEITSFVTPTRGGAMTNYADSKGNIWYTVIRGGGGRIGRFNPVTQKSEDWSPVYGAIFYGIIVDQKDRVWAAGLRKGGVLVEYDPKTEKFTEHYAPTVGHGPRRLAVDSKNRVWFSEYFGGAIGTIDAETGKITEYKFPLKYTESYEVRADLQDNIWATDDFYESLIKFDIKTQKFTYYPLPTTALVDVPKMAVAKDGTMWFYPRGRNSSIVEAFQPAGNTPDSCYPWMNCRKASN